MPAPESLSTGPTGRSISGPLLLAATAPLLLTVAADAVSNPMDSIELPFLWGALAVVSVTAIAAGVALVRAGSAPWGYVLFSLGVASVPAMGATWLSIMMLLVETGASLDSYTRIPGLSLPLF